MQQIHQSFIRYRGGRYALWAIFISLAAITAYIMDAPRQPPNGGTILGYVLGILGALIIIFLMWFGVRKRSYSSKMGTVSGWLSAHVYLGVALIVVATLHTGFQLGINIHTFNYILMCLVILSGIWGAYTYLRYPYLLNKERGNVSREVLFQQIADYDQQSLSLARNLDLEVHDLVADAVRRTSFGGGRIGQLFAKDGSKLLLMPEDGSRPPEILPNPDQRTLIDILAEKEASAANEREADTLDKLLEVIGSKASVLRRLRKDIQLQGLMQYWLYFHLPLSFALLAALTAHIISVFLYW